MTVLAHEVGHKIGPEISKANGHDLRKDWASLVDCYKSSDSIRMTDGQEDETIADYISSEVIAKFLNNIEPAKRKDFLSKAIRPYCVFSSGFDTSISEGHPESIYRVEGIFGASKSLRDAIGCTQPNPAYQTCSLNK